MSQYRLILLALVSWLFVFYNIERLHEPFNIASFVYVLSALGVGGLIVMRRTTWRKTFGLFAACFVMLLLLKWQWGYPILGAALPITVTETVALLASFAMAHFLSSHLDRFETSALDISLGKGWEDSSFDSVQPHMYREVNRARRFARPISLAFLRADQQELNSAVDEIIRETQRRAAQRLAEARITESIGQHLRDCDLVARFRDGFVVLLPETDCQTAETVADLIRQRIKDELKIDMEVGLSSLPSDEITLTGLLSRACHGAEATNHGAEATNEVDNVKVADQETEQSNESSSRLVPQAAAIRLQQRGRNDSSPAPMA